MKTTSQVTTVSLILAVALLSVGSLQAAKAPRGHKNPIPPGRKVGPLPRPRPRPPVNPIPPGGNVGPLPWPMPGPAFPDRRPQAPYIAPQPGPAMWGRSASPVATASARMGIQRSTSVSGTPVQRSMRVATPEANVLSQAYRLLSSGEDDSNDRRTRALRQISIAARLQGTSVDGAAVQSEDRLTSDQQLGAAQALLEQARSSYAGDPKVLQHLNAAHQQVSVALGSR